MTPLGFKVEQNTNAYEVHPPKTALGRLAEAVFGKERPMEYTHSNYSAASAGSSLSLERNCRFERSGSEKGAAEDAAKGLPR
jgi:hypothetical protein